MDNLEELQRLIEASPLFRDLQPTEANTILARLHAAHYKSGTRIMERGNWHGQLHIIASGHVSVLLPRGTDGGSAEEYTVARLGPGECFGEMSLITGEPPTATIRAEQHVAVWSLAQADFLTLIGTCPTLVRNINAILTRRLSRTNQHLLAKYAAEMIWLALFAENEAPSTKILTYSIAEELARCSQKRVLFLELCATEQAVSPRFAHYNQQMKPTLLQSSQDHTLLQTHEAPTVTSAGQHFPAIATLAETTAEVQQLDAGFLAQLTELAVHYDYLLLATSASTPPVVLQAVEELSQRGIAIIAAEADKPLALPSLLHSNANPCAIFVAQTPMPTSIGRQDSYAAQLGRPVTRLLPANDSLLEQCWQQQQIPGKVAPQADLTKAIQFVARHIARQTVGIAFGGGGARGFAHLGVLERLLHYGVPLDYISACSSGIITPGMYLLGKSIKESEEIFLDIQRHIVQWNFPRVSIFSNKGLKHMLRELCGEKRFEDLATPFAMVAVDLATRAGVVLDRGPIWQAGLASVALPGIFPPVLIGEHILMDAGMHDPVPIRLARKMGADILLASELGGQEPPALESATPWLQEVEERQRGAAKKSAQRSPHIVDVLLKTYDLSMATIGMHSIREADVVIRPHLYRISLRQFSEGRKFVDAGRAAVEDAMPAIKKNMPWL